MIITRALRWYKRDEIERDSRKMYIFTDNTNRTSGNNPLPASSWYSQTFGPGLCFPTMTSALIRGLPNAFPLTTQHWYSPEHRGDTGRWTDADFEEFKRVIDEDFERIEKEMRKYEVIVFPPGGIFNSKIANITEARTPRLYEYLMTKCKNLMEKAERQSE